MEGGEDGEVIPYAPWFQVIVDEAADFWDDVVVLEASGGSSSSREWLEVKSIRVPDTQEAAAGKGAGVCKTYDIQRNSTILLTAGETDPPYIGLVDKLFRKRGAKQLGEDRHGPVYKLSDFGVHAYWLYRPAEVPSTAWRGYRHLKGHTAGCAAYRLPGRKQLAAEGISERQLLFSSHHTLHDYPDDYGILALDGFLQECKVHWLGSTLPEVPRLEVHGSTLVAVQEPGFVVRGFLWCAAKREPQLAPQYKTIHKLEDRRWPDKQTAGIVAEMCAQYQSKHNALVARNRAVLQRFHAAKAAKQQSTPSDYDEEDEPAATASAGGVGKFGGGAPARQLSGARTAGKVHSLGGPEAPPAKRSVGGAAAPGGGQPGRVPPARSPPDGTAAAASTAGQFGCGHVPSPRLEGMDDDHHGGVYPGQGLWYAVPPTDAHDVLMALNDSSEDDD